MFDLSGKRALVTGASGGIGSAIAKALHRQGAVVSLSGTRLDALEKVAQDLGERAHVLQCDLSDSDQSSALPGRAEEAMGGLDILICNAGVTKDNLFVRMKDEEWNDVIEINLSSNFHMMRAALRGMMKQRYGRIIGITSIVGVSGHAGQGNYSAAKAGMIAMNKSVAQEVASRGITVNSVAPGFIATPMTDVLNEKQRHAILSNVPLARLGTSEEIAAAVVYLSSDSAAYVTGQTLHVNGGLLMV